MQNTTNQKLNFVFFGTPDVASETLEILKENDYLPTLIVTSPDAKRGRGMYMEASPVANFAKLNKIPCLKPDKLDADFTNQLKAVSYELSIVVAYGKIIPEQILNMPKLGSINIHYSLLPKYRGASPVESAILNGETETGVTIQKMEFEMDAGAIIAQKKVAILSEETAPELRKRLIKLGGELLVKLLKTLSASSHSPFAGGEKQDEVKATYTKKIKKEDGLIDMADDPVKNYNKFRAYATWPRTFFLARRSLGEGGFKTKRIIITKARLEDNKFIIEKIIPENGKEMDYKN